MNFFNLENSGDFLDLERTNFVIAEALATNQPFLAARIGSTELRATIRSLGRREDSFNGKVSRFLRHGDLPFFSGYQNRKLNFDSGFFPINRRAVDQFAETMVEALMEVDLLGSWNRREQELSWAFRGASLTRLSHLEPFFSRQPWTHALRERRVLVIHPFAKTIEKQYFENRQGLFPQPNFLPIFELLTLEAVQSLGKPDSRFKDWFEGLDWMTENALGQEFEVALVGCGAYGLPLAARLKKSGKRVLHLGGATQVLFGIRGRRWEQTPKFKQLMNENWVRPRADETPVQHYRVGGGGSYW